MNNNSLPNNQGDQEVFDTMSNNSSSVASEDVADGQNIQQNQDIPPQIDQNPEDLVNHNQQPQILWQWVADIYRDENNQLGFNVGINEDGNIPFSFNCARMMGVGILKLVIC